ncbi:MAG: TrkA family potassium uptake protein [Ruminococcaceae bacterium]|nr:TrkA family potassium uptake protein [Oscillospiraceae bacterium]
MFGKKKKKTGKPIYGIVGLGRFGQALAQELYDAGADLIIIDRDEEKIAMARDWTENAFIVRGLDKKTLLETGMHNCDVAVVCIGSQIDTSILTSLNLVSIGVPKVISKATSIEHGEILEKLGAEVVYPERDMGIRLAHRLETSQTLDYVQLSEKINISKIMVPPVAVGQSVVELNLRGRFGLNIVAVENHAEVVENIGPKYVFRKDDILYLSGSKDGFLKLSDWTQES